MNIDETALRLQCFHAANSFQYAPANFQGLLDRAQEVFEFVTGTKTEVPRTGTPTKKTTDEVISSRSSVVGDLDKE